MATLQHWYFPVQSDNHSLWHANITKKIKVAFKPGRQSRFHAWTLLSILTQAVKTITSWVISKARKYWRVPNDTPAKAFLCMGERGFLTVYVHLQGLQPLHGCYYEPAVQIGYQNNFFSCKVLATTANTSINTLLQRRVWRLALYIRRDTQTQLNGGMSVWTLNEGTSKGIHNVQWHNPGILNQHRHNIL